MNLINLANLDRFPASSMTPNLMLVENSLQKAGYNFSSIFLIMSKVFLTNFFLITFKSLCCCNCSLETFRGKSSESTTPEIFKIQFNVVKGQLISKCPYEKSVSSKIPTKLFLDFCPEIFCSFLRASWKLFGLPWDLKSNIINEEAYRKPKKASRKL